MERRSRFALVSTHHDVEIHAQRDYTLLLTCSVAIADMDADLPAPSVESPDCQKLVTQQHGLLNCCAVAVEQSTANISKLRGGLAAFKQQNSILLSQLMPHDGTDTQSTDMPAYQVSYSKLSV